jgi:hypothetical protein
MGDPEVAVQEATFHPGVDSIISNCSKITLIEYNSCSIRLFARVIKKFNGNYLALKKIKIKKGSNSGLRNSGCPTAQISTLLTFLFGHMLPGTFNFALISETSIWAWSKLRVDLAWSMLHKNHKW